MHLITQGENGYAINSTKRIRRRGYKSSMSATKKPRSAGKRKRIDDEEDGKSRFDKVTVIQPPPKSQDTAIISRHNDPTFESLPRELFLHIIGCLGPTSTSLLSLASVNRQYNNITAKIGESMLLRAKQCFRSPMCIARPGVESSISLFVRYSKKCNEINDRLVELKEILADDFKDTAVEPEKKRRRMSNVTAPREKASLTGDSSASASLAHMDRALDTSLDLISEMSNSSSSPHNIVGCSTSLETKLLVVVGKCGGKAFKITKSRLQALQQQVAVQVSSEEEDADDALITKEQQNEISMNFERLDKARLIMQQVIFHKLLLERSYYCNAGMRTRRYRM